MEIKQKIMTGVIAGAALGIVAFGGAAPAQAGVYNCPTSIVCVYEYKARGGLYSNESGFSPYSNLLHNLVDNGESWINACNSQHFVIGDWVNGKAVNGQHLPPGWWETDLATVSFANRADYVGWL